MDMNNKPYLHYFVGMEFYKTFYCTSSFEPTSTYHETKN